MGIPLDGIGEGRGGLGRTEGGAAGEEWSTDKGVGRVGVEHAGVTVIDQSMNWNALFANRTWSILWAAAYQASISVLGGHPKDMVVI